MTNPDPAILGARPTVPDHVLFQEVAGNAALLNLETETYFGLDEVGTAMWQALETAETIGAAAESLAEVYDASLETLRQDIATLAQDLRSHGLLIIGD